MKNELILCECTSVEHQMIITEFEDEPHEIIISIHLAKKSFWKRFKYAIKYLFGYQCIYGAFEEIIVKKEKLLKVLGNG